MKLQKKNSKDINDKFTNYNGKLNINIIMKTLFCFKLGIKVENK